jgi:hypothetical protein
MHLTDQNRRVYRKGFLIPLVHAGAFVVMYLAWLSVACPPSTSFFDGNYNGQYIKSNNLDNFEGIH